MRYRLHLMCTDAEGKPAGLYREVIHIRELENLRRGTNRVLHIETEPLEWFHMFEHAEMEVMAAPSRDIGAPLKSAHTEVVNSTVDGNVRGKFQTLIIFLIGVSY